MNSPHDMAKRWRPRFSVRTLGVVVTLVCCYTACWGPTKTRGVHELDDRVGLSFLIPNNTSPVAPLIISVDQAHRDLSLHRHYYFWFYGYIAKLPFERAITPEAIDGESGATRTRSSGPTIDTQFERYK